MPKFKIKFYDPNKNERKITYMDTDELILMKLAKFLEELDEMPTKWTIEVTKERD